MPSLKVATIITTLVIRKVLEHLREGLAPNHGPIVLDILHGRCESILVQMPVRDARVPTRTMPCRFFPHNLQRDGKNIEATWQIISNRASLATPLDVAS